MKNISKTKEDNNSSNDDNVDCRKSKIEELERENDVLLSVLAAFQRLMWANFEDLIDSSYLLRKAESELGEERYQSLYAHYMNNIKTEVLKNHKRKAREGIYIFDFAEIDELISKEIPATKK